MDSSDRFGPLRAALVRYEAARDLTWQFARESGQSDPAVPLVVKVGSDLDRVVRAELVALDELRAATNDLLDGPE